MTRKGPYDLDLTTAQRRELEARARAIRHRIETSPRRDRAHGHVGPRQRGHCRSPRHQPGDRVERRKRFFEDGLAGLRSGPGCGRPSPPEVVIAVKSLARELPSRLGVPLAGFSYLMSAPRRESAASSPRSRVPPSGVRSPKTPSSRGGTARGSSRGPDFEAKAARFSVYAREWDGKPLGKRDFVLSTADKPPSRPASVRHETLHWAPARTMPVEHEYTRGGTLQHLAAWDVHRAEVFWRCEPKTASSPLAVSSTR